MPYFVYVIELDPAVARIRRFRDRNPRMDLDGRCLYVGQSAHEPDCRYRQHKECHGRNIRFSCICDRKSGRFRKNLSNRYARKYGLFLRRQLYEKRNPIRTRKQAERIEHELAMRLRASGHGVWWG